MRVLGVDPGISGAIAVYDGSNIEVADVPTFTAKSGKKNKTMINIPGTMAAILGFEPDFVFMEKVGAMPGQGVTSMFRFGEAYGILQGLCSDYPVTFVTPQTWKKFNGIPPGSDKDSSRQRATQLFPSNAASWARKKDNGRTDAALIARYGYSKLMQEGAA